MRRKDPSFVYTENSTFICIQILFFENKGIHHFRIVSIISNLFLFQYNRVYLELQLVMLCYVLNEVSFFKGIINFFSSKLFSREFLEKINFDFSGMIAYKLDITYSSLTTWRHTMDESYAYKAIPSYLPLLQRHNNTLYISLPPISFYIS